MNNPKVLITTYHKEDDEKKTIYGPPSYLRDFMFWPFYYEGFLPLLLPAIEFNNSDIKEIIKAVDFIVLVGGDDVDPLLYNEEVKYDNVRRSRFRDKNETLLIENAIKYKKPIFGICRGLELINVFFGGSLYQNIKEQCSLKVLHRQNEGYALAHKISIKEDTFLEDIYDNSEIFVNSFHKQAVKKLGKDLRIAAISSDGIIEAIQHTSLPIYAVQWHPELSYNFDENSKKLIRFCYSLLQKKQGVIKDNRIKTVTREEKLLTKLKITKVL